jgi:hypothetical protein
METSADGVLAELNVESRTVLAFRVADAAIQKLLPAEWSAVPNAAGPSQGTNLNLIFTDRLLVQEASSEPMPGQATNQLVVLAVPARRHDATAQGVLILFGLSAQPAGAPGPYGVFQAATAATERLLSSTGMNERVAAEKWHFAAASGEQLSLQLEYQRGIPARSASVTRAYSADNPQFFRTYHADQAVDVLRSSLTNVDRISHLTFSARGGLLDDLFDGSEQLVSVYSLPWTVRQAFLPA